MLVGPVVPEKTLERLKEKESIVGLQEARSNGGSAPHIRHNQRILYLVFLCLSLRLIYLLDIVTFYRGGWSPLTVLPQQVHVVVRHVSFVVHVHVHSDRFVLSWKDFNHVLL